MIKRSIANYFTNTPYKCEKQPKQMWKTINQLTGKNSKTTIISEVKQENQSFTDASSVSNTFNTYFNEIGTIFILS